MAEDFEISFKTDTSALDGIAIKTNALSSRIVNHFDRVTNAAAKAHQMMERINHVAFILSGFKALVDLYRDLQTHLNKAGLEAYKLAAAQADLARSSGIKALIADYKNLNAEIQSSVSAEAARRKLQDIEQSGTRRLQDAKLALEEQVALDSANTEDERKNIRADYAMRRNDIAAARASEDSAAEVSRLTGDAERINAQVQRLSMLLVRQEQAAEEADRQQRQAKSTAFDKVMETRQGVVSAGGSSVGAKTYTYQVEAYREKNEDVRKEAERRLPELTRASEEAHAKAAEIRQELAKLRQDQKNAEAELATVSAQGRVAELEAKAKNMEIARGLETPSADGRERNKERESILDRFGKEMDAEYKTVIAAFDSAMRRGMASLPSLGGFSADSYAQRGIVVGGAADARGVNESILKVLTDFYHTMKARDPSSEGEVFRRHAGGWSVVPGV